MTELAEYKGYRIEVNGNGVFTGYRYTDDTKTIHESVASADSLKELQKRLDKISKASMQPRSVFIHNGNRYVPGKMTSAIQGRYGTSLEYRVSFKAKRTYRAYDNEDEEYESWSNVGAEHLIKDTPENRALVDEYNALEDQHDKARERQHKISEELVSYSETELAGQ